MGFFFIMKTKSRKKGASPVHLHMDRSTVMMPLESERNNPDNYPSLSTYLERTGKLKLVPKVKMLKARRLYVIEGMTEKVIAEELDVDYVVVLQWVNLYSWTEQRDLILFRQFQGLQDIKKHKEKYLDARHDRIASTLETTIEGMLHRHMDPDDEEFELCPKDLTPLANALKQMQNVRRTVHDKAVTKTESHQEFTFDTGEGLDNLLKMVSNLVGGMPKLDAPKNKQISVTFGDDGNDREFEE